MRLSGKSILIVLASIFTNSTARGADFCIENSEGLFCVFESEQECEDVKQSHELCLENPRKSHENTQKQDIFPIPDPKTLCFGPVCIGYSQEVCSLVNKKTNDPIICRTDK